MQIISVISLWIIPIMIAIILVHSLWKKKPAYENFVEGGKEGIKIAISIIPFLIGMLVAITIFRASFSLFSVYDLVPEISSNVGFIIA